MGCDAYSLLPKLREGALCPGCKATLRFAVPILANGTALDTLAAVRGAGSTPCGPVERAADGKTYKIEDIIGHEAQPDEHAEGCRYRTLPILPSATLRYT